MKKGKILVVDDDRLVLAMVSHGLTQSGYEVIDADNGDEAILLAREHQPDIALLDIRMEGKTGFDVAQYLRDVSATPFVFLSAFSDEETVAKVQALGAIAYLVKPLEVGQIVPAVDAALARARELAAQFPSGTRRGGAEPDVGAAALEAWVPLALGILMHRYSLPRNEALERLRRTAKTEERSLGDQAMRIVQALEDLAAPGAAA